MNTATAPRTIDVREKNGPHCEEVLAAFDSLAPGEALVVVSNHVPAKLLRHLQQGRRGEFEFSPLEGGPERYRTQLTKREAARGSRRTVLESLAWDHDRLEAIEGRAFELFASDAPAAGLEWTDFCFGLKRHIRFEEDILFPAFEEKTGLPPNMGPTAVMRAEHREIEALLDAIGHAFAGTGDALALREQLHGVLGGHNVKEEQVLYPSTDSALGADDSDALVARIQAS